jgi:hypothetical protein
MSRGYHRLRRRMDRITASATMSYQDRLYWRRRADEINDSLLTSLRSEAEGWRNLTLALFALIVSFGVPTLRDSTTGLPGGVETAVKVLAISTALLLCASAISATVASLGVPFRHSLWTTAPELRKRESRLIRRTGRLLKGTSTCALAAILLTTTVAILLTLSPRVGEAKTAIAPSSSDSSSSDP